MKNVTTNVVFKVTRHQFFAQYLEVVTERCSKRICSNFVVKHIEENICERLLRLAKLW